MSEFVEKKCLDPVFLSVGQKVYSNEYIEELRKQNETLKAQGKPVYNLIPQAGFQEKVLMCEADMLFIGGSRGGGKTWIALYSATEYIDNPLFVSYGFRKLEDDIKRGLWESSKHVFSNITGATAIESSFEWKFSSGARFKMEQLYDAKSIKNRFRGAEQPFMLVEEVAEYTENNLDVLFALIGSNRNTIGVKNKFIATCNPVGKKNKLRHFLEWYIDPTTDMAIPERSGQIRYFYRCGKDIKDIVWGNTKEEVYNNINAKNKIDRICAKTGADPLSLITSLCFIDGGYKENKILQISDKDYLSKLQAQGDETAEKDLLGIWRDVDDSTGELSVSDMIKVFENNEQKDGYKRASADVALTGDFFVIWAFDGRHVCDIDAWIGMPTDSVVPFVKKFLSKNGVRDENFTYDSNGLGLWFKGFFEKSKPFNNKLPSTNQQLWNNLKSECAEKFVKNIRSGLWSIDEQVLNRIFVDKKGNRFSVKDRLLAESKAIKRKVDTGRFEIITKKQMISEIGHSPDFIEGWFMVEALMDRKKSGISGLWWI